MTTRIKSDKRIEEGYGRIWSLSKSREKFLLYTEVDTIISPCNAFLGH